MILEISKIPLSIPNADVPEVVLDIMNTLISKDDDEYTLDDVHAIHRRQGHYTKEKVLVKFVRRGDAFGILKKAWKLRKLDVKNIDRRLTEPVYINEHLSPYYSKLRFACKLLYDQELVSEYWVSGHKVKVKMADNSRVHIIRHKDDLINLIPIDISHIILKCKL